MAQTSARGLFIDAQPGSRSNPLGPVGFHYWFQNERGERFVSPSDARDGAVRLHLEANASGWLEIYLITATGDRRLLDPNRDGRYPG